MPDNPYATATPASANLGYGKPTEASIDQANIAMRGMPWYQAQMRAWGQDPGHPTLTKSQSQELLKQAQSNGFVVDEGDMEMDDHGNFNPKGHKLRNTIIVAGIAAAAIAAPYVIGALASTGGAGGAAAAGSAAMPAAAGVGGITATSLGLPVTAGLGTAGAATAAGVGGGVTAGGSIMPTMLGATGAGAASKIPSWLAPAIGIAGNLAGTAIAAKAESSAADKQAAGVQAALDFEKQQYADMNGRLQPYIQAGTTSTDRMSQLLGLPARTGTTATATPTRGPAVGNYQPPAPVTASPSAALVTLQAPDGSTKDVPPDQVPHYQALGAKVLRQGVAA